jgi:hypothetical protein
MRLNPRQMDLSAMTEVEMKWFLLLCDEVPSEVDLLELVEAWKTRGVVRMARS